MIMYPALYVYAQEITLKSVNMAFFEENRHGENTFVDLAPSSSRLSL